MSQPILETKRLILRPLTTSDGKQVQKLAGDEEIAARTLSIPHPYEDGMAEAWISSLESQFKDGRGVTYAVALRSSGGTDSENSNSDSLIGCIGLEIDDIRHDFGEIGFWIGKPFWGNGYCTEAGMGLMDYGFSAMQLNCISGNHFSDNPKSGNVMRKLGMEYEGLLRQRKKKNGEYKDLCVYSVLREDYLAGQNKG